MNSQRPLLVVGLMALSQTLHGASVSVRDIVMQPTSVRQGRQTTVRFSARATHPEHAVVMLKGGFFTDGVWGQGRLLQTTAATKADDGETWTAELRVPADVPAGTKRVYTWFRLETLGPLALKLERKGNIVAADPPIDAQALAHSDGTTYLVVTNLDLDNPQRAAVRLRQELVSERVVNVLDGTNVALTEDGLTLDLKPGEALFLKLHQPE